jgi:hypothetical protein
MKLLPKIAPMSDNDQRSGLCQLIGKVPDRFLKLIDIRADGCWIWLGSKRSRKYKHRRYFYGTYSLKYAHRVSFEAANGSIPSHLELDHLCQNKLCVNPKHLELVTHQENCKRRPKSGPYRTPGSQRDRREKAARPWSPSTCSAAFPLFRISLRGKKALLCLAKKPADRFVRIL